MPLYYTRVYFSLEDRLNAPHGKGQNETLEPGSQNSGTGRSHRASPRHRGRVLQCAAADGGLPRRVERTHGGSNGRPYPISRPHTDAKRKEVSAGGSGGRTHRRGASLSEVVLQTLRRISKVEMRSWPKRK